MILPLLAVAAVAAAQDLVRTDGDFYTARDLWFSDEASCIATYGHIKDWNTSAVSIMSDAFADKASFDEDISG